MKLKSVIIMNIFVIEILIMVSLLDDIDHEGNRRIRVALVLTFPLFTNGKKEK